MGVPKFYRWLSERYPLINQIISNSVILPEFDNFYLDMNGIIHACTHPNDNHASNSLTLREMMLSIFRYVDRMVTEIVKPKKVLFLAIDGVAPRAKLNQQRARRFRAAQDRIESIEKAKQRGDVVDEETLFDSNCITPGTEFMEMVSRHLKWFIRKKMKEDTLWRDLTIVFSGHDVPGEGEHKIMQYIRDLRASPNYEPNIRHCMYGQDADLIMLGLASHEPHFALLREVINFNNNFGKKTARETVMRQTKDAQFQLLHISLLREYISIDFAHGLPPGIAIDQERIIDDFIFLTFLVGNDFLPHLPTLDISEHAFDVLINAYRQLLIDNPPEESLNSGYLVHQGELCDLDRLEKLFTIIGSQEQEILKNREAEKKKFDTKQRKFGNNALTEEEVEAMEAEKEEAFARALQRAMKGEDIGEGEDEASAPKLHPQSTTFAEDAEAGIPEEELMDSMEKMALQAEKFLAEKENDSDKDEFVDIGGYWVLVKTSEDENDDDEEEGEEQVKEKDYRGRYYYEKYHVIVSTVPTAQSELFLSTLMRHYLQGLMWCLAYYIKGCISWTWYYPYHYGPMLQDMKRLQELSSQITFTLGGPFTPFQQLLGCLPPASSILLPSCYRWLMISEESPVISFYPATFDIDQDGKKNPWEAVVKLDFINELRLFEAEEAHCPVNKLTKIELHRNQFGKILQFEFDPANNETYLSCNPEIGLLDIHNCQSKVSPLEYSLAPGHYFQAILIPGTIFPIAGYPCLAMLPIEQLRIESLKVNIFGSESRYRSVILQIDSSSSSTGMSAFVEDITKLQMLLGKKVYVNYPQVHEAVVVGISSSHEELQLVSNVEEIFAAIHAGTTPNMQTKHYRFDDLTSRKWSTEAENERMNYLKGRKLPGTGGLDIGEITIRVKVRPLQGLIRNPKTGASTKLFAKTIEADIPLQMVLWQPPAIDTRFQETEAMSVEELFPLATEVIAVTSQLIGCKGRVVGPHVLGAAKKGAKNTIQQQKKKQPKTVDVEFDIPLPEPPFGYSIAHTIQDEYYSSRELCQMLQISPSVFGKLVGSIRIEPGRYDVGLNLKRNGMYQLLGYARKIEKDNEESMKNTGKGSKKQVNNVPSRKVWQGVESLHIIGMDAMDSTEQANKAMEQDVIYWEYSKHTASLICEYKSRFPGLFQQLESLPHAPVYNTVELLGKGGEQVVNKIMEWMKEQSFFAAPRTPFSTASLSKEAMVAIERASDVLSTTNKTKGMKKLVIKGIAISQLYTNIHRTSHDVPLAYNTLEPKLGDRIVNLTCPGVPFGLRGTVITIHHATKFVEVVFDEEFTSGKSLQGSCSQFRGKLCAWTDLLLLQSQHRNRKIVQEKREEPAVAEESSTEVIAVAAEEVLQTSTSTTAEPVIVKKKISVSQLFASKIPSTVSVAADTTTADTATATAENTAAKVVDEAAEEDEEDIDDDQSGASIDQLLDEQVTYNFQGLVSDGTGWYNLSLAAGIGANEKKLIPEPTAIFESSPWMSVIATHPTGKNQLSYVQPVTFQPSSMQQNNNYHNTTHNNNTHNNTQSNNTNGPKVVLNKAATDRLVKHELGFPSRGGKPQQQQQQQQQQQEHHAQKTPHSSYAQKAYPGNAPNNNNHNNNNQHHNNQEKKEVGGQTKKIAVESLFKKQVAAATTSTTTTTTAATSTTTTGATGSDAAPTTTTKSTALKAILLKKPASVAATTDTTTTTTEVVEHPVSVETTGPVLVPEVDQKKEEGDATVAAIAVEPPKSNLKNLLANAKKSFAAKQAAERHETTTENVPAAIPAIPVIVADTIVSPPPAPAAATVEEKEVKPSATRHTTTTAAAAVGDVPNITNMLLHAKKKSTTAAQSHPGAPIGPPASSAQIHHHTAGAASAVNNHDVRRQGTEEKTNVLKILQHAKRIPAPTTTDAMNTPTIAAPTVASSVPVPPPAGTVKATPVQYKSVTSLLPSRVQILKKAPQ